MHCCRCCCNSSPASWVLPLLHNCPQFLSWLRKSIIASSVSIDGLSAAGTVLTTSTPLMLRMVVPVSSQKQSLTTCLVFVHGYRRCASNGLSIKIKWRQILWQASHQADEWQQLLHRKNHNWFHYVVRDIGWNPPVQGNQHLKAMSCNWICHYLFNTTLKRNSLTS